MKLSEAVALGLPEIKFTNKTWLHGLDDGGCEGCLAGAALWAEGSRRLHANIETSLAEKWPWSQEISGAGLVCPFRHDYGKYTMGFGIPDMQKHWTLATTLTHLASHYERGELTSEQIVEFIRSFEPTEAAIDIPLDIQLAECEAESQDELIVAYA